MTVPPWQVVERRPYQKKYNLVNGADRLRMGCNPLEAQTARAWGPHNLEMPKGGGVQTKEGPESRKTPWRRESPRVLEAGAQLCFQPSSLWISDSSSEKCFLRVIWWVIGRFSMLVKSKALETDGMCFRLSYSRRVYDPGQTTSSLWASDSFLFCKWGQSFLLRKVAGAVK